MAGCVTLLVRGPQVLSFRNLVHLLTRGRGPRHKSRRDTIGRRKEIKLRWVEAWMSREKLKECVVGKGSGSGGGNMLIARDILE